jgi:hypothetical protein
MLVSPMHNYEDMEKTSGELNRKNLIKKGSAHYHKRKRALHRVKCIPAFIYCKSDECLDCSFSIQDPNTRSQYQKSRNKETPSIHAWDSIDAGFTRLACYDIVSTICSPPKHIKFVPLPRGVDSREQHIYSIRSRTAQIDPRDLCVTQQGARFHPDEGSLRIGLIIFSSISGTLAGEDIIC